MIFENVPVTSQILELNFGNWEVFRQLVTGLREIERSQPMVKFDQNAFADALDNFVEPAAATSVQRKKSVMEKQVHIWVNCYTVMGG